MPGHAVRRGDVFVLRTEPGRVWAGKGNMNRIAQKHPVEGKDAVVIEVELVNATGKYEQCGLLYHEDDEHFVKQSKIQI